MFNDTQGSLQYRTTLDKTVDSRTQRPHVQVLQLQWPYTYPWSLPLHWLMVFPVRPDGPVTWRECVIFEYCTPSLSLLPEVSVTLAVPKLHVGRTNRSNGRLVGGRNPTIAPRTRPKFSKTPYVYYSTKNRAN